MILLLNVYLAPDEPWFSYDRGGLPTKSKLEILEYTLLTYGLLGFRKAYLNIEVDARLLLESGHPESYWWGRWIGALEKWTGSFNVEIKYRRCRNQSMWQAMVQEIEADLEHPNEPIWYSGNHDHPCIVPDPAGWREKIEKLFPPGDPHTHRSVIYSHWAEFVDQAAIHDALGPYAGFVMYRVGDVHSIRVVSPGLFRSWWFDHDYGDIHLPRSDWWVGGGPWDGGHIPVKSPLFECYVPMEEICRHFDGYSHIGISPHSACPPLTIPHTPENYSISDRINVVAHKEGRRIPTSWYS